MRNNQTVINIQGLSKTFKTRGNKNLITGLWKPNWKYTNAVVDASFSVRRGQSVAFLGPNGAGKTTTTKILSGIMYPTSGNISVLGHTPQDRKPEFLKRIGLVMGNKSGMNWDLTARQSYALLKEIYEIPDDKFDEQLDKFSGLLNINKVLDRQIRRLSLGERMKVEIVGAILHDPEILFLDEPTIGLDIDAKFAVREFLINLQKHKNVTIILTSHDMDDIEHVCQQVIVINEGRLIFNDSLQKLNNKYSNWRYVKLVFEGNIDDKQLEKYGEIIQSRKRSRTLKIEKNNLVKATAAFGAIDGLIDINIESVPLEKIVSDLFNNK